MTRSDLVLAALAAAPTGTRWQPVQVQKLFFLLEQQAAAVLGGPHWNFKPYDYGPFDAAVYSEIAKLAEEGLAEVTQPRAAMRTFTLTGAGADRGARLLLELREDVREYMGSLSNWVRALSFEQLVSAIYRQFPEMKANSVFRE